MCEAKPSTPQFRSSAVSGKYGTLPLPSGMGAMVDTESLSPLAMRLQVLHQSRLARAGADVRVRVERDDDSALCGQLLHQLNGEDAIAPQLVAAVGEPRVARVTQSLCFCQVGMRHVVDEKKRMNAQRAEIRGHENMCSGTAEGETGVAAMVAVALTMGWTAQAA